MDQYGTFHVTMAFLSMGLYINLIGRCDFKFIRGPISRSRDRLKIRTYHWTPSSGRGKYLKRLKGRDDS